MENRRVAVSRIFSRVSTTRPACPNPAPAVNCGPSRSGPARGRAALALRRAPDPGRGATAEEIEEEIAPGPEPVLHVVPEDVEEEHVPEEMQPAAVEEHAGEQALEPEAARHQTPVLDELVGVGAERDLVAEHEHVHRD